MLSRGGTEPGNPLSRVLLKSNHGTYREFALGGKFSTEADDATDSADRVDFRTYPEGNPFRLRLETEVSKLKSFYSSTKAK